MSKSENIRRSVIAGSWYPGTGPTLRCALDEYFARVDGSPVPLDCLRSPQRKRDSAGQAGSLLGLISPHAGYAYSGLTAAHAYHQLVGRQVDTVVIVAPSHRIWLDECAVSDEDAYETPLGLVPLDKHFIAALSSLLRLQRIHGDAEHSIEIQLPFLQRQLSEFQLVPILMSTDDVAVSQRLATAVAEIIRGRRVEDGRVLLVASSDMHHIENYDEVVRRDRPVVDAIAAYDLEQVARLLMDRRCSVCGRMPILAVLHACRLLGADAIKILHHTNSGDVTGQRWSSLPRPGQYTVGYMAAAIYKTQ